MRGENTARRRRLAAALAVLLLVCATAALADTPVQPPDTEYTPVAKSGCGAGWRQVSGDTFPNADTCGYKPANTQTPTNLDLYTVAFRNGKRGFAGGAICSDPDPKYSALPLADCPVAERTPAIYEYSEPPGEAGRWTRVQLPGTGSQGFVGAIAWIDGTRALAVGGDGTYPERESATTVDDPAYADPAGHARAWLDEAGSWCELGPGRSCGELKPGMTGLTAAACSPYRDDAGFCIAGGLGKVWHWRGSFTDSFDMGGSVCGTSSSYPLRGRCPRQRRLMP